MLEDNMPVTYKEPWGLSWGPPKTNPTHGKSGNNMVSTMQPKWLPLYLRMNVVFLTDIILKLFVWHSENSSLPLLWLFCFCFVFLGKEALTFLRVLLLS